MSAAQLPATDLRRPWWLVPAPLVEAVVTVIVLLALVVELITVPEISWRGFLPVLLVGVGFAALRRVPVLALVLAVLGPLVATGVGVEPLPAWNIGVFVALLLALRGFPAVLTGAAIGAANFLAQAGSDGSFSLHGAPAAYAAGFAALAAAAGGSAVRSQYRYASALEQRTAEAVARRDALVHQGIAEERLRIARDLHDGVGHAVAVVNLRIGAAEVRLPAGADDVRADLHAARAGIQEVLQEMQQILRVLRIAPEEGSAPTPQLTDVPELLTTLAVSGRTIRSELSGLDGPVAPQTGTAVYRIVQEALTNAHKYGEEPVRVVVRRESGRIRIEVSNAVRDAGPENSGGGRGLVGMRERATAAGGRLDVAHPPGEFVVTAELPAAPGGHP